MISRSILSNYAWSLGSMAVSKGLRFLGVVICIRLVGTYSWGQVASTLALYTFLGLVVDQGLSAATLLFRLRDRAADGKLLLHVTAYRSAVALLLTGALFLAGRLGVPLGALTLAYTPSLLLRALNIEWWFHRRELYQVTMILGAFRTLVFYGMVAAMLEKGSDAGAVIRIELVSEALTVAAGFLALRFAPRRAPQPGTLGAAPGFGLRELILFSFPLFLITLLNNVQNYMDILLLKAICGVEAVAEYDMGIKIGFMYFFLGASLIQIIKPKITRLSQEGDAARLESILKVASSVLVLLSAAFLVPSLYYPEASIRLIFGADRGAAAFTFQWAAVWVAVSFITMLNSDTLLSLGRRRDYFTGAWLCALLNIAANIALLRWIGPKGAILAKILSEAAFLAFCHFRLPAPIRAGLKGSLLVQGGVLAGFVSLWSLHAAFGQRSIALALSAAGVLGLAAFGRTFRRGTLAVLREN